MLEKETVVGLFAINSGFLLNINTKV